MIRQEGTMSMSDSDETFTPEVEFLCPFCGLLCAASSEGEHPGVVHAMPPCARFEEIDDPSDFLAACNAIFSGKKEAPP
jgi:hypothetical protein